MSSAIINLQFSNCKTCRTDYIITGPGTNVFIANIKWNCILQVSYVMDERVYVTFNGIFLLLILEDKKFFLVM
jgi:hypothetical protein